MFYYVLRREDKTRQEKRRQDKRREDKRREEKRKGSTVAPGQDRGTSIISIYHMSVLDGGCDPGFYIIFCLWHLGVNTSVA